MKNSISIVLILFAASHLFSGDLNLEYKMQKETTLTYDVDSKIRMVQEMMGQENVSDIESDVTVAFTTQSSGDDMLCLHAVYKDFQVTVSNARMDTTMSLQDYLNKKIKVDMTKWGDTINVTAVDSFPQSPMMRGGSDPKQIFQRFFPQLPKESVSRDGTWTIAKTDTVPTTGGQIVVTPDVEFTAKGMETVNNHECLKVNFNGDLILEGEGTQQGVSFFIEGDGTVEGTYYFDLDKGVLVKAENSTTQDMTIAITGQQNMTIPQTQTVQSTSILVEE